MHRCYSFPRSLAQRARAALVRGWLIATTRSAGQGLVEYGLILVLIMVVCVGILSMTGQTISDVWYQKIINNPAFQ
jgi:hypothetical protein